MKKDGIPPCLTHSLSLVSLNVFNESLMNDAVYKFKRYEDASLTYTGIDRHAADAHVGLHSTTISRADYAALAGG